MITIIGMILSTTYGIACYFAGMYVGNILIKNESKKRLEEQNYILNKILKKLERLKED